MAANRFRDSCPLDCKVYVGELGTSGNRHELEEAFGYYGPLRSVWVAKRPPGFAFVMFEDPRDARDAVRSLDGELICGRRIKAELSTGKSRREGMPQMPPSRGFPPKGPPVRGGYNNHRDRSPISRNGPPARGGREYHGHSNHHENNQHFDSREHYNNSRYPRKHKSWSRSRSFSPPVHGHVVSRSSGRSGPSDNNYNGQHMRSRSRSPPTKSPRSDSRYR